MNWTALGALGQLAAAVAVLITLIYLARQVRQSNRQNLCSAFRHTCDSLNEWALSIVESAEIPAIILRGRHSYKDLSDIDRLRFDDVHFDFLNIIESHYYQVQKTAMDDEYRKWALGNPEIRKLIADRMGDVRLCDAAAGPRRRRWSRTLGIAKYGLAVHL